MTGKLPDFIIIGAMKSATSTLQEQLALQPGIFMSDPKEPNFFSDDSRYEKGMEWYSGLFKTAPDGCLLGEASTHYTKLPNYPHTVKRLKEHLPEGRFIYVMRHPVNRLVSHYIHEWTMGVYQCGLDEAIESYPELVDYGQYAMQLKPFIDTYGWESVLPVFFDRMISNPQSELERICRFIGYQGEPHWVQGQKASNVSSERIRRFPLYSTLIESSAATWFRRTLVPQALRDRVKKRLTMQKRPTLHDDQQKRLEEIFDRDLATLSKWLGKEINCSNFKTVTAETSLNWVKSNNG
ncbi:MAG: sulfotransferase [Candidatus Sedimenticola sp. (ex Thyasira tokunagai)]